MNDNLSLMIHPFDNEGGQIYTHVDGGGDFLHNMFVGGTDFTSQSK